MTSNLPKMCKYSSFRGLGNNTNGETVKQREHFLKFYFKGEI